MLADLGDRGERPFGIETPADDVLDELVQLRDRVEIDGVRPHPDRVAALSGIDPSDTSTRVGVAEICASACPTAWARMTSRSSSSAVGYPASCPARANRSTSSTDRSTSPCGIGAGSRVVEASDQEAAVGATPSPGASPDRSLIHFQTTSRTTARSVIPDDRGERLGSVAERVHGEESEHDCGRRHADQDDRSRGARLRRRR